MHKSMAGQLRRHRIFEEFTLKFELDTYDRKIIALLQTNARLGFSEIGRRIHLTPPAVAERVRRMEEAQVIRGFMPRLNLRALGYILEAFVNITVDSHDALDAWANEHPEVLALHVTTGSHCALLRVAVTGPEHLQLLISSLAPIGKTTTSIVLSTLFEGRARVLGDELTTTSARSPS